MKKIFSLLFVLVLLVFPSIMMAQTTQKAQIAVYVVGSVNNDYKKVIEAAIVKELSLSDRFRIADRSEAIRNAITTEYSAQSSGSVDLNQIVQLGREIGAQYLFVVDVSHVFGEMYAVGKLINMEANSVIVATDNSGNPTTLNQMQSYGNTIARDMLSRLSRKGHSNQKAEPQIVGPLTFNEVINYRTPPGYKSSIDGILSSDVFNEMYKYGKYVKGDIAVNRFEKSLASNLRKQSVGYLSFSMASPSEYEHRDNRFKDDDYYTYSSRSKSSGRPL